MQRFSVKPKIITVWWAPLSVFPILDSVFTNPYSVLCSMPTPGKSCQESRFLGLLHLMNHSKSTKKFHHFHYWFYEFYCAYPLDIQNQDTGFLISWPGNAKRLWHHGEGHQQERQFGMLANDLLFQHSWGSPILYFLCL